MTSMQLNIISAIFVIAAFSGGVFIIGNNLAKTQAKEEANTEYTLHEIPVDNIEFTHKEGNWNSLENTTATIYTKEDVFVWVVHTESIYNVEIIKTEGDEIKATYETSDKNKGYFKTKLYIGRNVIKEYSAKYAEVTGKTMPVTDNNLKD